MIPPLFIQKVKQRLTQINLSFEVGLIIMLAIIVSSISYTGILAYQSLIQLTEVVSKSSEPEVKILLIKGVSNELVSAESNIKSFALSKDRSYMRQYNASLEQLYDQMSNLDSMIPATSLQQIKLDSIMFFVAQKITYLNAFAEMQQRGTVINELNSITFQLEQSKKRVAQLNATDPEAAKNKEKKAGFFKRMFNGKELKQEEAIRKRIEVTDRLKKQIAMLESVRLEINKVKKRQGKTLERIDSRELSITQRNKVLTEKMNAYIISLEMDELANTRKIIEDIDKRHNRTDKLISIFSVTAAVFLIIIGFVVVSFIRKKNNYQKALLLAKKQAEAYSELQERFLANMSHEIRTPMNAIAGFTEQLLKTELKEKQQSYVQIVQQSVNYLLVIINDILDYAKLKADKLSVENIPFSVGDVVKESIELLKPIALQKGVEIKVNVSSSLPVLLMGDPVRMKQVLLNLVGNALKFTEKGSVTISLTQRETKSFSSIVQLSVLDTGIGISENNMAKIFNAFEQAEVSTTRKYGGSGLGLSITQKLVQLLNGTLELKSKEGKGTEAIVLFELLNTDNKQQAAQPKVGFSLTQFATFIKGKEILIADDEEWNTALLATIFQGYDIRFVIVKNGKEVLAELKQRWYDIVLMDVRMPELNGFEATKKIRKLKQPQANIPIIGLTADTSSVQVKQAYESGMNAVLGKPFSELQLCERIHQILLHPHAKPIPAAIVKESKTEKNELYSLAVLTEMSHNDNAFIIKMLTIFIQNGKEGFDQMQKAIAEANYSAIADIAHKITPSARQLDANGLMVYLKQIETSARLNQKEVLQKAITNAKSEFEAICKGMQKTIEQLKK